MKIWKTTKKPPNDWGFSLYQMCKMGRFYKVALSRMDNRLTDISRENSTPVLPMGVRRPDGHARRASPTPRVKQNRAAALCTKPQGVILSEGIAFYGSTPESKCARALADPRTNVDTRTKVDLPRRRRVKR